MRRLSRSQVREDCAAFGCPRSLRGKIIGGEECYVDSLGEARQNILGVFRIYLLTNLFNGASWVAECKVSAGEIFLGALNTSANDFSYAVCVCIYSISATTRP